MKRALILSGGGARGAFQVGMLHELIVNKGLDFDVIRGVSVGSLNAAILAEASTTGNSHNNMKKKAEKLKDIWLNEIVGSKSIYKKHFNGRVRIALGLDSLNSLKPLRNLVQKNVKFDEIKNKGRNFAFGTVSLVSGEYFENTVNDPEYFEKFIASSSIPVVFPFVKLKSPKDVQVDGGVRNITPLGRVFQTKPDEIYNF